MRNTLRALACAALLLIGAGIYAEAQSPGIVINALNGTSRGPSVRGQDRSSGLYFGATFTGISKHVATGGFNALAVSNLGTCGTSPSVIGTDTDAEVTMGTATPTGCVITFVTPYAAAPLCIVNWQATPLASQSWSVSTTALTLVQTATSSNKVNFHCTARAGG